MKFLKEYGNVILIAVLIISIFSNVMQCSTEDYYLSENQSLREKNDSLKHKVQEHALRANMWMNEYLEESKKYDSLFVEESVIKDKYNEMYENIGRVRGFDSVDSLLSRFYSR